MIKNSAYEIMSGIAGKEYTVYPNYSGIENIDGKNKPLQCKNIGMIDSKTTWRQRELRFAGLLVVTRRWKKWQQKKQLGT